MFRLAGVIRPIADVELGSLSVFKKHLSDHGCLVLLKNKTDLHFQQIEVYHRISDMVRSLPKNIKDAYMLSKIMLNTNLCPKFEDVQGGFRGDCPITSYILKTAVLHLCNEEKENDQSLSLDVVESSAVTSECLLISDSARDIKVVRSWVWNIFDWIENKAQKHDISSFEMPWEDLLAKNYRDYEQVPLIVAACRYVKQLIHE